MALAEVVIFMRLTRSMNRVSKEMHHASVYVHNLDLGKYAESCGTKGYRIKRAHDLLFILKSAREDDKSVSVIAYAVDYFENIEITDKFSRRSLK